MKWYLKVLRQYADFEGRACREEYWMFVLFNVIFSFAASFIGVILFIAAEKTNLLLLPYLYLFAVLIPGLAVSVRRLHDTGRSAWYLLINMIPIVGGIWLFVLMLSDSQPEKNRYGENPKTTGIQSPFNCFKSAAVALIITSVTWIFVNLMTSLLNYIWMEFGRDAELFYIFMNNTQQILSGFLLRLSGIQLLYLLIPTGLLIVGFVMLQKKTITDSAAYIILSIAGVWIFLRCYDLYVNFIVYPKYLYQKSAPADLQGQKWEKVLNSSQISEKCFCFGLCEKTKKRRFKTEFVTQFVPLK
ncbi:MAG: DUF805 domain-containing protein, partial [Tannerella sp.]|nr:DUF805 domain-containing protein [Tannerella sp.]